MHVVLDIGVLIAALINTNTPPALIYQAWRKRRFEVVTSEWQLAKLHLHPLLQCWHPQKG
jgi:predicted nucleic acid-binding protein